MEPKVPGGVIGIKPQPVITEEEKESYELVPAGTLMRVLKRITTTDGVATEEILSRDVLWGKTKQDLIVEADTRKAQVEAEAVKLEALKVELSK